MLTGINLTLGRGRFLGIVGPNGGGKTTLLRTLLGFVPPLRGSVRLLGRSPRDVLRDGWRVGYLPQRPHPEAVFPASALDVALMGRFGRVGLRRRPGPDDRTAAERSLDMVGMLPAAHRRFSRLSGGEQQRVSIARALAGDPEILMLDEPSTSVDTVAQEDFYRILKSLQAQHNLTIIMSTHDVGVVSTLLDEIACLNCTLSFHGPPTQFDQGGALAGTYGPQMGMLVHGKECRECPAEPDD